MYHLLLYIQFIKSIQKPQLNPILLRIGANLREIQRKNNLITKCITSVKTYFGNEVTIINIKHRLIIKYQSIFLCT